jgi:hypothetical protein
MKKALLAALFVMVISSWCLAQTDSLPAPTAEPCQPATCSEPCQPGACDMPWQPAPCAEPFVPKWAVGLRTSSLINLPGSIYLERLYQKSSLEYYLSTNISGDISSQDGYLESRYDNDRLNLGVTYKRLISSDKRHVKFYLGFGPEVYYGRSYHRYSYYYVNSIIRYGLDLSVFMQIRIAKDMVIKNIRLSNEINFTPASAYVEIGKRKSYKSYDGYDDVRDTTIESIEGAYGIRAISTGSVSYSIKYLF